MKLHNWFFLCLLLLFLGTGCSKQQLIQKDFFAMDTYMQIKVSTKDEQILEQSVQTVLDLEKVLSKTIPQSDIYLLNHANGEPVTVHSETYELLEESIVYAEQTQGAFDISISPISDLWNITAPNPVVPNELEITNLLSRVSYKNIQLLGNYQVALKNGATIDVGGIGKGYATDVVVSNLKKSGVKSALVSLAGNVYALGKKPNGKQWKVAIKDPDGILPYIGVLSLHDQSVVTSGAYERAFEQDGVLYHHIFDAKTGYPSNSDLKSVTIISKSSTMADAFSTGIFILGSQKAKELYESNPTFEYVLITKDNQILCSAGIVNNFEFTAKESEYSYEGV